MLLNSSISKIIRPPISSNTLTSLLRVRILKFRIKIILEFLIKDSDQRRHISRKVLFIELLGMKDSM